MDEECRKYYFDLIYEKIYRITDSHIETEEYIKDIAFGDIDIKDILFYGDEIDELKDEVARLEQEVDELEKENGDLIIEKESLINECDEYSEEIMNVERFLDKLGYSLEDFRDEEDELDE